MLALVGTVMSRSASGNVLLRDGDGVLGTHRPAAPRRPRRPRRRPHPRSAAKLTKTQLRALLRHAGRQRCIDAEADRLHAILRAEYLHQPPLVENALGQQVLALLRQLDTASANADELATAVIEQFEAHSRRWPERRSRLPRSCGVCRRCSRRDRVAAHAEASEAPTHSLVDQETSEERARPIRL